MNPVRTDHDAPRSPAELMQRFGERMAGGELDKLLALYEPEAVFVPEPGVVCATPAEIGAALGPMLALSPTMETQIRETHVAGDLALVIVDWTMRGVLPDGSPIEKGGTSADVLRRKADGTWRVLIDHP